MSSSNGLRTPNDFTRTSLSGVNLADNGIFKSSRGSQLFFKSLEGDNGITLTTNTNDVTIDATGGIDGGTTVAGDTSIFESFGGGTLSFRGLTAGSGISIAENENDVTISDTLSLSNVLAVGNTTSGHDLSFGTGEIQGTGDIIARANAGTIQINANVDVRGATTFANEVTAIKSAVPGTAGRYLYLNDSHNTAVGQSSGWVVSYLPSTSQINVAIGGFTAGLASTSNPTVIVDTPDVFSVGDIILITDAANELNNGFFEVLSHTGTTLTIRGIGTTATLEDWPRNQFTTDSDVSGVITKTEVRVTKFNGANLQIGAGSTAPLTYQTLIAYSGGNGISVSGGTVSVNTIPGVSGSYTSADVTVNQQGQITSVSNGTPVSVPDNQYWILDTTYTPTSDWFGPDPTYWSSYGSSLGTGTSSEITVSQSGVYDISISANFGFILSCTASIRINGTTEYNGPKTFSYRNYYTEAAINTGWRMHLSANDTIEVQMCDASGELVPIYGVNTTPDYTCVITLTKI